MNFWRRLTHRRQLEEQLEKEIRFHLEERAAELGAGGTPPAEARRQARLELHAEQVKEECRDARGTRRLEDLWQDLRYGWRVLRQNPGYAAVALLTLALGTGATTVMFTVVNSVLLKPLPFPQPDRLLTVTAHTANSRFGLEYLSYPDFLDLQHHTAAVDLAGWVFDSATLSAPGEAEYEQEFEISHNLFSVLGVPLYRGRAFLGAEDQAGAAPVAILGYSLWQRKFAGSANAIGGTLVLDGQRMTIVGVAPPNLQLDGEGDVYTPLGQNRAPYLRRRRAHPVRGIARLRPGATLEQAQSQVAAIGHSLAEQYPDSNKARGFVAEPMRPDVQDVAGTLWLLLGAVTLVLLIACANVASLMLARTVASEREWAMRAALGAGRGRLVRQSLTESGLLAVTGAALGIALAVFGIRPFLSLWPGDLPRASEVQLDWRVLGFALAMALGCGLLFGMAPALRLPARALERVLRAHARTTGGGVRRWHGAFVMAEMALAVVLLVSAGMLGRTLLRLSALDPGVNTHNVLVSRMALSPATLPHPDAIRAAWDDILDRARRVPGVEAVATVDTVPLREGNNQNTYWTSAALPPEDKQPVALATCVSPDYLKVMGIPLRSGRFFTAADRTGSPRVIVVDEVLAQNAFGTRDVTGRQLWIPDWGPDPAEIVGVVGHVRYWGLAADDRSQVRAQYYYPFAQVPDPLLRRWSQLMSITVRSSVPPLSLVAALRNELRGTGNDQVLYDVRTLDQLARNTVARQRFLLQLFAVFAGQALALATIGIYGVQAYLTLSRIPEIGIRMALGATGGSVMRMVLRDSLRMTAGGLVAGIAGAVVAARVLMRLVEGMQPGGWEAFGITAAVLAGAALFASFWPARQASRIDPMRALRQE